MINPIFLILASVFILTISVFNLNSQKENYVKEKQNYERFDTLAFKYSKLKNSYSNKKIIIKDIQKIISSARINKSNIQEQNNTILVKLTNLKTKQINKFVNNILNKRFNIIKLEISTSAIVLEVGVI